MGAKRLPASERRAQLLRVARAVFARRGFEAASMEEIAKRGGVSKPIVYEHFGGKEGLYAVVVDREREYLVARIAEAISSGTPRERFESAALAFLKYAEEQPDGFAVLIQDSPLMTGPLLSSLMSDVADRVSGLFASEFKKAGYDAKTAPIYAHALTGMVTFVGLWWIQHRKPSVEVVASHLASLGWMGLRHLPNKPEPIRRNRKKPSK